MDTYDLKIPPLYNRYTQFLTCAGEHINSSARWITITIKIPAWSAEAKNVVPWYTGSLDKINGCV